MGQRPIEKGKIGGPHPFECQKCPFSKIFFAIGGSAPLVSPSLWHCVYSTYLYLSIYTLCFLHFILHNADAYGF